MKNKKSKERSLRTTIKKASIYSSYSHQGSIFKIYLHKKFSF